MLMVLSFASIAGIAFADVVPGEIESEVMVVADVQNARDAYATAFEPTFAFPPSTW
jgi:hypothetical protein